MNIRKIKLALTVDLMNASCGQNILNCVKELMGVYKEEAGDYMNLKMKDNARLDSTFEQQSFALQYEKCTLDLDLVMNKTTQNQFINGFNLKINYAA